MNHLHKQRLWLTSALLCGLAIAVTLILLALNQNMNVFLTPSQISVSTPKEYPLRLGGLVKEGSVKKTSKNLQVKFTVTDLKKEIQVIYYGILPDLFREGKGVIIAGKLNNANVMLATQVLAKHDENYMPANVYKALRDNNEKDL